MNKKELTIRKDIINAALILERKKLNQGKAGNISVRWDGGLLITPSGIAYDKLKPEDIVFVDKNKKYHGKWKPSSETPFHFDILKNKKDMDIFIFCTNFDLISFSRSYLFFKFVENFCI